MRHRTILLLGFALACPGCRNDGAEALGPRPRLVVFSPALTKILFDMGLGDHVVGVTSYCRLPEGEERPVVGSALSVRAEPILAVEPDVILTQLEVKHFEPVRKMRPDLRIEHFRTESLADVADAIERVARITGHPQIGLQAKKQFQAKLEATGRKNASLARKRAMFVLGYENPIGAGGATFLDEMIRLAGGINVLAEQFEGWKHPSIETVLDLAPEVIVCQCEPGEQTEAVQYWRALGKDRFARQVIAVTDKDWTLPAGHLADYTGKLQEMIHRNRPHEADQP